MCQALCFEVLVTQGWEKKRPSAITAGISSAG